MSVEPTYLEIVESYLVDEFHHGLHRIMVETLWSDVRVGEWSDALDFFKCLSAQYQYLITNQTKPLQIAMHVRDLNFSGQATINGGSEEFLKSRLVCSRQKILLLHSLRLMIEGKDQGRTDLSMLLHAMRRESHQCLRLVFFYLKGDSDRNGLQDFIDNLDRYDWLEMNRVRSYLTDYLTSWLERQGVKRMEVDDMNKLRSFLLTLNGWISYHPQRMPEPVHFEYGHVFSDWQKVGFFRSLHYEIDRLTSLVYLEGLSHSRGHTLDVLTGVADRRSFEDEIVRWMTRTKTEGQPFIFAMLDVDDFKAINTKHGQLGGDFALKSVAEFFKSYLGPNDFIARWGEKGDEFVFLLEKTSLGQAEQKLSDMLSRLANTNFEYQVDGQQRPMNITLSCGLAECGVHDDQEQLIHRANQTMHDAKNSGKNQVSSGLTNSHQRAAAS